MNNAAGDSLLRRASQQQHIWWIWVRGGAEVGCKVLIRLQRSRVFVYSTLTPASALIAAVSLGIFFWCPPNGWHRFFILRWLFFNVFACPVLETSSIQPGDLQLCSHIGFFSVLCRLFARGPGGEVSQKLWRLSLGHLRSGWSLEFLPCLKASYNNTKDPHCCVLCRWSILELCTCAIALSLSKTLTTDPSLIVVGIGNKPDRSVPRWTVKKSIEFYGPAGHPEQLQPIYCLMSLSNCFVKNVIHNLSGHGDVLN